MASSLLFPLFSLALIGSLPLSTADDVLGSVCKGQRNYAPRSAFQANLDNLLRSLSSVTPNTGFAQNTSGNNPDKVYGLAVCRGDINSTSCRSCLAGAHLEAPTKCPGKKEANIFYEFCQLRYSDQDFFGTPSGNLFTMWNPMNISNVASANRLLGRLLEDLAETAAFSERMFAAGSMGDDNSGRVYALAQCTRDLAPQICKSCLQEGSGYSATCCGTGKGARIYGGSCFIRFEDYKFYEGTAVVATLGGNKKKKPTMAAAIAVAVIAFLASIATILIYIIRRRQKEKFGREEDDLKQGACLHFSFDALKAATKNFSKENMLGRGGFGIVYKGVLADGKLIAVKKLLEDSIEGLGELKNELGLVAKLQHRNLVRLLGYCLKPSEKILVYEYLTNRSLDTILFDPIRSKELTWDKRVKIIEGISRGLLYLHEDSRMKIIHRDVKASNILLDDEMHPKIADFGLARTFRNEQSYTKTLNIAGTHGYMAPEYITQGEISAKSDVYSFGILVLEIVTGKKCTDFYDANSQTDLISYISWLWEKGNPLNALDYKIQDDVPSQGVLKIIQIALLCVQRNPRERPNMSLVVQFLSHDSTTLPPVSPHVGFNNRDKGFIAYPWENNKRRQGHDVVSFTTDNTFLEAR